MNPNELNTLIDMASGRIPTDLLITNCRIIDVFNQVISDGPLAIGKGKIIGCGEYQANNHIDAKGGYVIPGLIDGHVHIESSLLTPAEFARTILPFGTTTVIADPHEIANVCGLAGIRYMLHAAKKIPLSIQIMLPSCVPATPFEQAGAILEAKELETLIHEDGVLGLAEVMDYPSVINHHDSIINKIILARRNNRIIDGHSPGITGKDLTAYIISGIMTDHECSTPEALLERLRQGQYVLLREGSTCKDLLNLLPAITQANMRRCILCTDDREPADILATGHINKSLQLAVTAGLDPILAITMATLNAAECFGLKGKGAIAPGYNADLLIVDNLKTFTPQHVFINGQEIARAGKMLIEIDDHISEQVLNTVHLAPLDKKSFVLPLISETIRTIGIIPGSALTENLTCSVVKDANSNFDARLNPGFNKLAVIERHHDSGKIGLAVLANYHLQNGAIAVTVAHDSHNIVVVGDNDEDMLAVVNDISAIGGGFSICQNGKILMHLPLPIAGLMSNKPADEVAKSLKMMIKIAKDQLSVNPDIHPLMTLAFMTLPVIPALKLTTNGLFDVKQFKPVELRI